MLAELQGLSPQLASTPLLLTSIGAGSALLAAGIVYAWALSQRRRQAAQHAEERALWEAQRQQDQQLADQAAAAAEARHLRAAESARMEYHALEQAAADYHVAVQEHQRQVEQQIADLATDLTAAQALAIQLKPTQTRVADLETVLSAERGRIAALEDAVTAFKGRMADVDGQLKQTQDALTTLQQTSAQQQTDWAAREMTLLDELEQSKSQRSSETEELTALRNKHQLYQEQSEKRLTTLQRQLSAAEARVDLVQKEFMSAVGVPTAPTPGTRPPSSEPDKHSRELEDQLKKVEAEARKKAREDGYRIAELEFKLAEALEASPKPEKDTQPPPA